jgi:hypothetical protein
MPQCTPSTINKKMKIWISKFSEVAGYKIIIQIQLFSYIPAMNKPNLKLKPQSYYISTL